MKAIRAHFDGKNVVVPADAVGLPPGEVLVIFNGSTGAPDPAWLAAQEVEFAKVWNNDEDAVYDRL